MRIPLAHLLVDRGEAQWTLPDNGARTQLALILLRPRAETSKSIATLTAGITVRPVSLPSVATKALSLKRGEQSDTRFWLRWPGWLNAIVCGHSAALNRLSCRPFFTGWTELVNTLLPSALISFAGCI